MESVDSQGRELSWSDLGVSVIIPRNAVPHDHTVIIKVWPCLRGPFVPPEGYEFTSPVYLISPQFNFEKEVLLRLHHFAALSTDCSRMVFVSAPSSPTFSGSNPQYLFRVFKKGQFESDSSIGSVSLMHFCFLATSRKRQREDENMEVASKRFKGVSSLTMQC